MMKVWRRWAVLPALLLTVSMMRPSHGAADQSASGEPPAPAGVWQERVDRFAGQWRSGEREQGEQEFLAYGRDEATAGLRQLIRELPRDDLRRAEVAFVLYLLDLDRALGRSVLVDACRPGQCPERFEEVFGYTSSAYEQHWDQQLLSAALNLTPYADGGAAEAAIGFVQQTARARPRDFLTVFSGKPARVRRSLAGDLLYTAPGHTPPQYPGLRQIAARADDPLHGKAQQLLREVDVRARETQAILAAEKRRRAQWEAQQFPLIPKGVTLPASAVKALQARYPHWHILATHGFDDRVVNSVHKRHGTAASPQHVWGDFDGNGLRDVALLMRPNGSWEVKLVALRQWKGDRWAADELTSFPFSNGFQGGYSRFTIYVTPRAAGEVAYWQDQGPTGRLDLRHDGVELNYEGKASVLYYWTGRAWATVQTGD